eukprot:1118982-Rhodomonas_salina.2
MHTSSGTSLNENALCIALCSRTISGHASRIGIAAIFSFCCSSSRAAAMLPIVKKGSLPLLGFSISAFAVLSDRR